MKQASRWKTVFLTLLIALIGAEIIVRLIAGLFFAPRHLTHGMPFFVDLRAGIFRYHPNAGDRPYSTFYARQTKYIPTDEDGIVQLRINAQGFRGEDFSLAKAPGTVRVAALGGSSTFGFMNIDSTTYPVQLQEILNERCQSDVRFQVYNFGIPYQRSGNIRAIFLLEALTYDPDVVTFYEGVNDTLSDHTALGGAPPSLFERAWAVAKSYSLMLNMLDIPLYTKLKKYDESHVRFELDKVARRFIDNVDAIAEACRERGIFFLPATQQAQSQSFPQEIASLTYEEEYQRLLKKLEVQRVNKWEARFLRHHALMEAMRVWATQSDLPLVDIITRLNHKRDTLLTWVHLDKTGNRLVAEAFSEPILERFCPPSPTEVAGGGKD